MKRLHLLSIKQLAADTIKTAKLCVLREFDDSAAENSDQIGYHLVILYYYYFIIWAIL